MDATSGCVLSTEPQPYPLLEPESGSVGRLSCDGPEKSLTARCAAAENPLLMELSSCGSSSPEDDTEPLFQEEMQVDRHHASNPPSFANDMQVFRGEWDEEGVYFYQAYNDDIADWAIEHQKFGGPNFNATRMTWIKPSFAWVLYRSGYACKHHQTRILKVKLSHASVAELLSQCQCKAGGGGSKGRVQWDPERDLMSGDGKVPREMLRRRAIQIGLKGSLSELYVRSAIAIEDVTELAHRVKAAHVVADSKLAMSQLLPELPVERPYMPSCPEPVLVRLRMMPGGGALHVKRRGNGKKR